MKDSPEIFEAGQEGITYFVTASSFIYLHILNGYYCFSAPANFQLPSCFTYLTI